MSPIELTDLHKSKLLEMCKELFPKWKSHSLITNEQYVSDDTGEFSESDETFKIHWFEFCMTHLGEIIYHKMNYNEIGNYSMFIQDMIEKNRFENIHLIDYLYEQFKQLK